MMLALLWALASAVVGGAAAAVTAGPCRPSRLVVGLNKYSHDAAATVLDANSGSVRYSAARERLTRKKHDGGGCGALVAAGVASAGGGLDDVAAVVANNHHTPIAPFERRLVAWAASSAAKGEVSSHLDAANLLPSVPVRLEISHHLAHAAAASATAPFDSGLVVVMDGMGERRCDLVGRAAGAAPLDTTAATPATWPEYISDVLLPGFDTCVQAGAAANDAARESESAYLFETVVTASGGRHRVLRPVYKRWAVESSELGYADWYHDFDGLGGLYSRVAAHVFGDWNTCGKVMGLAPWVRGWGGESTADEAVRGAAWGAVTAAEWAADAARELEHVPSLCSGRLLSDDNTPGDFAVHSAQAEAYLAGPAQRGAGPAWSDPQRRAAAAALSAAVQRDLETCATDFLATLQRIHAPASTRLAIAGGVGLNSVFNGIMAAGGSFEDVWVPSAPGDDGISLGCAAFGAALLDGAYSHEAVTASAAEAAGVAEAEAEAEVGGSARPRVAPSPYGGAAHPPAAVEAALDEYAGFVHVQWLDESAAIDEAAAALADGEIVALWASGGAEYGPRALGRRSIVADPRNAAAVDRLNRLVKKREPFRPFAPSVLAEHADEWFAGVPASGSPYMSFALPCKRRDAIPAVCHVDGSARLQTVSTEADPRWRALIAAFFALTGVPLVLNTSFNTRPSEPIVEGPANALAAFLHVAAEAASGGADGSVGAKEGGCDRLLLLLGDGRAAFVRARRCPLAAADGEEGGGAEQALGELRATRRHGVSHFVSSVTARESGEPTSVQLRAPSDGGAEAWADGAAGEWLAHDEDGSASETFTPDAPREAWVELNDELELATLEMSDGATVKEIVAELDADHDEVVAALRSLWERRYVAVE